MPESLGIFNFDFDGVNKTPRVTAKQGDGTFLLYINEAQLSDTGLYYCVNVKSLDMTFVEGTFLRIQGKHQLYQQFIYLDVLNVYIKMSHVSLSYQDQNQMSPPSFNSLHLIRSVQETQ